MTSKSHSNESDQQETSMIATYSSSAYAGDSVEPSRTRKQIVRELTVQQDRLNVVLENIPQGICIVDELGNLVVCNRNFLRMVGLTADAFQDDNSYVAVLSGCSVFGDHIDPDVRPYAADYLAMISQGNRVTAEQQWCDDRVISIVHQPLSTGGFIETFDDITESRRSGARTAHVTTHDALTDLPNRAQLRRQIEEALSHEIPDGCALMYIDLDRFKNVNDALGSDIGDNLLQQVAKRISQQMSSRGVVARIGGDEFAVLIRQDVGRAHVAQLAERLICVLSDSYTIQGHTVVVGTSVGIAIAPEDGADWAELAKHADLALYEAKSAGRGCYRFFEGEMERSVQAKSALSLELQQAIGRHEFELYYQPLINLHPQRINGFEALLRWRNPKRGLVTPGEFVPLAEELGLIAPIGEWVLRHACWRATRWPEPLRVSVNLSVAQFRTSGLVDIVASALRESGLAPHRLELEITESMMLDDTEAVVSVLHRLRRMGVSIAMDDFGTGFSSMSYLTMFPFDRVKIDQSFTKGIGERPESEAVIWAVMGICKSLGIDSTAEGVETNAQLELLSRAGCSEAQGYFFSRPRPEQEIAQLLAAWDLDTLRGATVNSERGSIQGVTREDVP
jgi:diguanylate cyclase (GGDEF)-like protein